MDPNYAPEYPHQPYNGNPHMHPGELVLLRIIGQGRWQHPFHEHANHVRILARDGNLILTPRSNSLAGPALFTTTTTPGQAMDGIFYYTGRGLNWDMYGHNPKSSDSLTANCLHSGRERLQHRRPRTRTSTTYEWCQDHNKPVQAQPFGDVAGGGPATFARSEHPDEWRMVWGQPVSRAGCYDARDRLHGQQLASDQCAELRRNGRHSALRHDRELPELRGRICVYVALTQ